jgi:hypothetical protein
MLSSTCNEQEMKMELKGKQWICVQYHKLRENERGLFHMTVNSVGIVMGDRLDRLVQFPART